MRNTPLAVVLGSSPTALYAVRELSASGYRVALLDQSKGCAWYSRLINAGRYQGSLGAVVDKLSEIQPAGRQEGVVLVPTNDFFIEQLINSCDHLVSRFRFFDCYRSVAGKLLDKALFYECCREHGVATPTVWRVRRAADVEAITDQLIFPCILKPELIHKARHRLAGKKLLVLRSRSDLSAAVNVLAGDTGNWLVQELIPGPESDIRLVALAFGSEGQLLSRFSGRKLRQYPAGFGSASLVSSERCLESEEIAVDFLRALAYKGVCGAEFKRDPRDGRLKLIEINPRPTLWFQIAKDSGRSILASAVDELMGRPSCEGAIQQSDVLWRYLFKDLAAARFYKSPPREFPLPAPDLESARDVRGRSWPVFSWSDPMPAVMEPFGFVRKAMGRWR
ncbi:carboxylate--amine ligase [Wenzhouxiangella marina]|uniref:Uncharacterized protein n=1 Tax=Wenzhouxiangella marina TaxID=1579979 RepID=A0A0K0XYQ3_9GAMM|nr:hypothetical protein [Wenzhouxiangella marina]AKS42752.1 hypothetical protein WM2015_2390 [Wenzhouxiangella marina]MBB6087572.1 putative ATP-grasp superfamily ATP-dependent carboligase [Wenzhouxiangella marina]